MKGKYSLRNACYILSFQQIKLTCVMLDKYWMLFKRLIIVFYQTNDHSNYIAFLNRKPLDGQVSFLYIMIITERSIPRGKVHFLLVGMLVLDHLTPKRLNFNLSTSYWAFSFFCVIFPYFWALLIFRRDRHSKPIYFSKKWSLRFTDSI